ncbi:DUF1415 domain-containing protein [Thiomicrorhabdus sp. 6S2-11]|jgi:hypothetical protein|uniref:DUF1415 domain-containing protein n=1 Tax=Thiomicrorhabdus marina TaxID=2818442 RepID=A0ABS3Q6A7_9GAMM|nr:DUF1415 domain-containing protein [Thiomicrorhabdus marina]MBO1927870.1 DUF1415 domain-containing protein [Thiomicrorhabdus marina]
MTASNQPIIQEVETWLQQVVIGLNLCPFAKHPWQNQQVHIAISHASNDENLLQDLATEITELLALPSKQRDTTILVVANYLKTFDDYNQFLAWTDALIAQQGWQGEVQIASFHPDYQFANTLPDDAENLTNRAPYPLLHILREASLEKALQHYPHDPETIFENNIHAVQNLSEEQKVKLFPYLFH